MLASNSKPCRSKLQNTWQSLALLSVVSVLAFLGCGRAEHDASSSNALAGIQSQSITSRGQLNFVRDLEAGCRLAAEKDLPCLLFFTAEWCTYCHEMEETAFADPVVAEMAKNFVCVLVDADLEKEICGQFSISGYPTVQFVSAQGRVLNRLVGRKSSEELLTGMRAALKRFAWLSDSNTKLR